MKLLGSPLIYLLALVVLSNGVFAAQMTALMQAEIPVNTSQEASYSPCHGDEPPSDATPEMGCCEGDCSDCMIISYYSEPGIALLATNKTQGVLSIMGNHLLPQHNTSLYRPPILI